MNSSRWNELYPLLTLINDLLNWIDIALYIDEQFFYSKLEKHDNRDNLYISENGSVIFLKSIIKFQLL